MNEITDSICDECGNSFEFGVKFDKEFFETYKTTKF